MNLDEQRKSMMGRELDARFVYRFVSHQMPGPTFSKINAWCKSNYGLNQGNLHREEGVAYLWDCKPVAMGQGIIMVYAFQNKEHAALFKMFWNAYFQTSLIEGEEIPPVRVY